jgi:hypothetical protein
MKTQHKYITHLQRANLALKNQLSQLAEYDPSFIDQVNADVERLGLDPMATIEHVRHPKAERGIFDKPPKFGAEQAYDVMEQVQNPWSQPNMQK